MPNTSAARTTVDDLLAAVNDLAPLLQASPASDEDAGQISKSAYDALEARGIMKMLAPKEFGGLEIGPLDGMRIVERLSEIDTATGWITMIHNSLLTALQFLEKDAVEKMYSAGTPRISGQGAPSAKAERVDGGYRLTGRWSYASGIPFANTLFGAAMVTENGRPTTTEKGTPNVIMFMIPMAKVTWGGNWKVLGLRATGSFDCSVEDVFVPASLTRSDFFSADMLWGGRTALVTFTGWLMWDHTAVELGLGRRLLDELRVHSHASSARRTKLADSPTFETDFAKAEAAFQAAHAWAYKVWTDIQETVDQDIKVTRRHLTDARAVMLHIHDVNAANASFAFRQAGGTSLREGVLQRLFRDAMATGQHILLSTEAWKDCGRDYLGDAEGLQWSIYNLV